MSKLKLVAPKMPLRSKLTATTAAVIRKKASKVLNAAGAAY